MRVAAPVRVERRFDVAALADLSEEFAQKFRAFFGFSSGSAGST